MKCLRASSHHVHVWYGLNISEYGHHRDLKTSDTWPTVVAVQRSRKKVIRRIETIMQVIHYMRSVPRMTFFSKILYNIAVTYQVCRVNGFFTIHYSWKYLITTLATRIRSLLIKFFLLVDAMKIDDNFTSPNVLDSDQEQRMFKQQYFLFFLTLSGRNS